MRCFGACSVERDRLSVRYVNVSVNLESDGGRGSCTQDVCGVLLRYSVSVRILCQPPSGGYGKQDWCTATLETCTTGLACWWMAGGCSWDCDKASFSPFTSLASSFPVL